MSSRLVKVYFGGQQFRDSYAIIPIPLSKYKKDDFDYTKCERSVRDKYKKEILRYLKSDCQNLFELVGGFRESFGNKLTIASAGMTELLKFHEIERFTSISEDQKFRRFYYGGRNQCFRKGILPGKWRLYDRNSMYPSEMKGEYHPISATYKTYNRLVDDFDFAIIDAENNNCLPVRDIDGSLRFTQEKGRFFATSHEIYAGLETNRIKILNVVECYKFDKKIKMDKFVDHFYSKRISAIINSQELFIILYKLLLNSPYGKFALNPDKFKEYCFTIDDIPTGDGWLLEEQNLDIFIWSRPAPKKDGFYNIATASSITGASRANLHRHLCIAQNPIYCDTDSIICETLDVELGNELGQWKIEKDGDIAAIAAKKLYALFKDGETQKSASKGVRLDPFDILKICEGQEIEYELIGPAFKLNKETKFTKRKIKI
jgi:hypothetical protein